MPHDLAVHLRTAPSGGLFSAFDLKPLADYVGKLLPKDKKAKQLLAETEKSFNKQLKEIQTVLARYQRLATLGQLVDHVLHEGRQPISTINNEADLGLLDLGREGITKDELVHKFTARLKSHSVTRESSIHCLPTYGTLWRKAAWQTCTALLGTHRSGCLRDLFGRH